MLLQDLRPSRLGCWLVPILLVLFGAAASAQEYPDLDHVGEKERSVEFESDDDDSVFYEDRAEEAGGVDDVPDAEEAGGVDDAPAAEDAAAEDDAVDPDVEVIRVTANRRSEDLQKVAVSVTALKGSFIEEIGLTDFAEIQKFTPNLQILPQGDSRSTSIRIRGIGSVGSNAGIDPSVGVFIDGVYQGRAGMSVQDLMDIDAVEVLRGPQGTLYGKNTAAGALKITSRTPNYEPSAMLEFVGGNYTNLEGRFTGNIPIIDGKLATRLTGYGVTHDGYETNVAPIHTGAREEGQEINDTTRWGLRSSTLWDVTDDVSVLLRGDYAQVNENCCTADTWQYGGPPDAFLTSALELAANMMPPLTLQPAIAGDRRVAVDLVPTNDVSVGGVSLEATVTKWEHTFTSLTAYRNYQSDSLFDGDFTEMDAIAWDTDVGLDQVSTELRVVSPAFDKFDYVAGFYFFYSDLQTDDILGFSEDYIRYSAFGGDDSSENTGDNNHQTTSVAGYADGNFRISDYWEDKPKITLTGGIRVGWEEKKHKGSQISTGYLKDTFCPNPPPAPCLETPLSGPDAFSDQSDDDTYVTGRAILKWEPELEWEPSEALMLYTSYATGYKSGGFNQLRTGGQAEDESLLFFEPENSQSFEGGLRSTWLDRLLTFNMTGFYTDYDNFQAQVFDGLGIRVINAGSFETYGFEADLTLVPLPGWITVFTAGYTITNYTDFEQGPCIQQEVAINPACQQDLTGKPLDNTPVWDLGLFSSYERQLPIPDIDDVNWFVMMDYNYQSSRYLNAALDPVLKVDPTHLLGFRAGLRHPDARWEVSAWIKNVTNENFWAVGFDVPTLGGYAAFQSPPRTFGGTIRVKF